jgi:hypothetical protein
MALTPPAPISNDDATAAYKKNQNQLQAERSALPATSSNKRARTSVPSSQVQGTVVDQDNRLSKYVYRDSNLLYELGWHTLVKHKRQRGDFGQLRINHPAQRFLHYLRKQGVPVLLTTRPWDHARIETAIRRGPHKSAKENQAFLQTEMADMIEKNQWVVLPYALAKTLPHLRISPIGVVPQRDRRPRTIVDYSYSDVNQETCNIAPVEAMQFGTALQRMIEDIVNADPRHGPVQMCKVDIADGFYRIEVRPDDIPKLGVVLPVDPGTEPLVAFPLVLPMGWKNSPPYFCAVTETVADVTNERNLHHENPPSHRLDHIADTQPTMPVADDTTPAAVRRASPALPRQALDGTSTAVPEPPAHHTRQHAYRRNSRALAKFDIYVDDFLGIAQGSRKRLRQLRRVLFHTLDEVLRPKDQADPEARQEPISIKKLQKGDACWSTTKQMLGWLIDTIRETITLPPHRIERLHTIIHSITPNQRRVSLQKWHRILGELRSMALAIPGARGLFSHLQAALQARNLEKGRIRVSANIRANLQDFAWLADSLQDRPTRLRELVAQPPVIFGTSDASGEGMGGVILPPPHLQSKSRPLLWRLPFAPNIQRNLATQDNPTGLITNSDLELAATIMQHDVICQNYDVREVTIHTSTDNQAAQAWQQRGSATTNATPAFLLRLQAIHQRFHRYLPLHSYLPGKLNTMADDASRLWHLSNQQLLTHFDTNYPQHRSWQLYHPTPEMHSAVISALRRQRSLPASFLHAPIQPTPIGESGPSSATRFRWIPSSRTSKTQLPSCKSTANATASEPSHPAVNQSDLARWRTRYAPLARRSRHWGPRIPAKTPTAKLISGCNVNCGDTPVQTHRQTV